MAIRLGLEGKLYYAPVLQPGTNTPAVTQPTQVVPFPAAGGPAGTDALVELDLVRDVTLNLEKAVSDVTTRRGVGFRQNAATIADGSVDFQMIWDDADDGVRNVVYCWRNNINLITGAFDGDITDATVGYRIQGIYGEYTVTNVTRGEELEEGMTADVTLALAIAPNPPEWVDRTV